MNPELWSSILFFGLLNLAVGYIIGYARGLIELKKYLSKERTQKTP